MNTGTRDAGLGTRERLEAGARALGLGLPPAAVDALLAYLDELGKWNAAYNLTAVRDPAEMVVRHVLDSLALLPVLDGLAAAAPLTLLDAGAGAGLPAFPLAIARPAWRIVALDSNGKKARFMRHAQRTLALQNLEVAEARVEAFATDGGFAVVTSRAFASLAEFFDKTAHLLAPGGQWVAMKGKLDARERAEVPSRFVIREDIRLHVPGLAEERHAVIAVPESRTPESRAPESRPS